MNDKDAMTPAERQSLVNRWITDIRHAEYHWRDVFKQMLKNERYVRFGCDTEKWDHKEQYTANLVQRVVSQKVAAIYAKNPKFEAAVKQRVEHTVWDGSPQTLMMAEQQVGQIQMEAQERAAAGEQVDIDMELQLRASTALEILDDYEGVRASQEYTKGVGKSLEILMTHYFKENKGKKRLKKAVRNAIVAKAGFLKVGFQRDMELKSQFGDTLRDHRDRLAEIEHLITQKEDGELEELSAEAEELKIALERIENDPANYSVLREGLVFDVPRPTSIICDTGMTSIDGFENAGWVSHKMMMSAKKVFKTFGVHLAKTAKPEQAAPGADIRMAAGENAKEKVDLFAVYDIWDRNTGMNLVVCDGHDDFLLAPEEPVLFYESGMPFFSLVFNELDDEECAYPRADIELIAHMQDEYNRQRELLREHRKKSRPMNVTRQGALTEKDKGNLNAANPHDVIEVQGLRENEKVADVIQRLQSTGGIDMNLYDPSAVMDDMFRVVGMSEASFGAATANGSATEATIAEETKATSVSENIDTLDDFLSEISEASSVILLLELDGSEVVRIAGAGARWPEDGATQAKEMVDCVYLAVRAGSSGKPNAGRQLAMLERAFPALQAIPGINPEYLGRKYLEALDAGFDLDDAMLPGGPSIMTRNSLEQVQARMGPGLGGGDAASGADQQAAAAAGAMGGANNAPKAQAAPGARTFVSDVHNNDAAAK